MDLQDGYIMGGPDTNEVLKRIMALKEVEITIKENCDILDIQCVAESTVSYDLWCKKKYVVKEELEEDGYHGREICDSGSDSARGSSFE